MADFFQNRSRAIFFSLFFLALADRLWILLRFAFIYTDSDQTVLWQAARDIARGDFHGFCFYGQAYNPLVEPLLAAPLLLPGIAPYIALPIITSLLALVPFILIAFFLRRRYDYSIAALPFLTLILLPPEFGMLTGISRGFVQGVFFGVIGILLILSRNTEGRVFAGGFCLGLALFANPNSVLLFPLLVPALFRREYRFRRLIYVSAGFLAGTIPLLFNNLYYEAHPDMVIHGSQELKFRLDFFIRIITSLDNYFDFISPLFWIGGWVTLFLFPLAAIYLFRKKARTKSVTVILLFACIVLSFFVYKVADATNSVFFSGARMFLAYPVIIVFICVWCLELVSPERRKRIVMGMTLLAVLAFSVKLVFLDKFLDRDLSGSKYAVVMIARVDDLKKRCEEMKRFAGPETRLVIAASGSSEDQVITYGCPCLVKNFPITIQPAYERRKWIRPAIRDQIYTSVLIHGKSPSSWNEIKLQGTKVKKRNRSEGWVIIENRKPAEKLLQRLGL